MMFEDIIGDIRGFKEELNEKFKELQSQGLSRDEKRELIRQINELLKKK